MELCEERYLHLTIEDGCDCDVAADRTFDALKAAWGVHPHCCDPRDRLFENKLREAAERLEQMPRVSWGNIEASTDGGFEKLPAGPYVVRITSATYNAQKQYADVVFDIAEGPKAGFYSDAWAASHPYAHHFIMSYKEKALPMTKGRLEAIQASNPGFDALAASDADRFDLFTGRIVGVNIQEEEYEGNDGQVRTRLNVCQVVPAQDVRDGKVTARDLKKLKKAAPAPVFDVATAIYDAPIPFD